MNRCSNPLRVISPLLISALAACDVNIASDVVSPETGDRTIQVAGSGSVTGEPDLATLDLGVAVERETVAEAREAAASAMTAILTSLRANQVAEEDMQTGSLGIHPLYDYGDKGRTLRGYMVNNTVRVKVRKLDTLGEVIDDAADAGGNSIVINSIQFMIEDTTPLQTQARKLAVEDAEEKARTLAETSGAELGEPLSITESTWFQGPPSPFQAEEALADAARTSTPVLPGELTVTVAVTVVYRIE